MNNIYRWGGCSPDLKGKKLLILAGAGVHCRLVETAKAMGVYTIVTDYLKTEDSPAKAMADEQWMLNITDVDGIVDRCKEEKIDGVLNVCIDPAQRPYQQICEKLGLPCFGDRHQFLTLTDKPRFKQFCKSCGLSVIEEYTFEEVLNGTTKYPLFVKPVDSRGSRGQTICFTLDDMKKAVKFAASESSNGEYVIEEYMGGKPDFSMTYLVCGGIPYLFRTADRHLGRVEDGMSRQTIASISPSVYTDLCITRIDPCAKEFIKKLGIINGPVLMQGFVDDSTIKFYDPGLRFPGNEYERLFANATGVNLMEILIAFALGEDITPYGKSLNGLYDLCGKRIIQIMYNVREGKIASIKGISELRKRPEVLDIQQRKFVGDTVQSSGTIGQRACEIDILVDDESDKIRDIINFVENTLRYEDISGEDMHISALNANTIADLYRDCRENAENIKQNRNSIHLPSH